FAGRRKDIVRVGGENVSAMEVEDVLYQIDGVVLAAVMAMPDEVLGEVVVAVIKPSKEQILNADLVVDYLKQHLASYKLPRKVVFCNDIPLTDSGKVQKRALFEQIFHHDGA